MSLSEKLLAQGFKPRPNTRVAKVLFNSGVRMSSELERILALPRRPAEFDGVESLDPIYSKGVDKCEVAGCPVCRLGPPKLWPMQSAALWEAHLQNGLFAPMGIGFGKTLVTLLLPDAMNSKRAVLFIKPNLRNQFWNIDLPSYGRHFHLPYCWTCDDVATTGRPDGLYVVAYSELSSPDPDKANLLERIDPDLVIGDEAHCLRHFSSARTKRFRRFTKGHPACRCAFLTGTPITSSIKDCAHLVELALRKNSPFPGHYGELQDWAAALDPNVEKPMRPGKLMLLCKPGESARQGFRRRFVETPGVVATSEGTLGTSLVLSARWPQMPPVILHALAKLRKLWAWDGNELEDGMAVARVAKQLAQGLYLKWMWPNGEPDTEWLTARNAWHREVREFLQRRSREGMDSPGLLATAAAAGRWDSETWDAWAAVKDRPEPPVEPVWLSDFLVEDVLAWGAKVLKNSENECTSGAIVWYDTVAFGERLAEAGLPFFGAGDMASEALGAARPDKDPVIVCSASAHGDGKNLQHHYSKNLVVTCPANAKKFEQLVGRTHRNGQIADEVSVEIYQHTEELTAAFYKAEELAKFIEETQGQRQKLLLASRNMNP